MKTLTTMFAVVVITASAFAKTNTPVNMDATQSTSVINGNHSYTGKASRKARRSVKLLLKNPFRAVSLNRSVRY